MTLAHICMGYLIEFAFLWSTECIIFGQFSIVSYLEHAQSIESSSEYGLRLDIWEGRTFGIEKHAPVFKIWLHFGLVSSYIDSVSLVH